MNGVHNRFLELAAASIDFELSTAERNELQAHLATCPSCARALTAMRGDARTVAALPVRALAAGNAPVILDRALRRQPDATVTLRLALVATLLALLVVGLVTVGSELLRRPEAPVLPAPSQPLVGPSPLAGPTTSPPAWQLLEPLSVARGGHTASLLPDGRVLVAGGSGEATLRSAEIYDPSTGAWSATGDMFEARSDHVAVALPDGDLLVISGFTDQGALSFTSERFGAGGWAPGPDLVNARVRFTAVLAGRSVVVIGGMFGDGIARNEVEIWEVDGSLAFVEAASLETPRVLHTATLLTDGRILVAGGIGPGVDQPLASAELFDPATGAWRTVSPMLVARYDHAALLLGDGRVLVAGGQGPSGRLLDSVEIYDPLTDRWTTAAPLLTARASHAGVVLNRGTVLVVGGLANGVDGTDLASAEWFDVGGGFWAAAPDMLRPRREPVLVALQDGSVMVIGGDTTKLGETDAVELLGPLPGS